MYARRLYLEGCRNHGHKQKVHEQCFSLRPHNRIITHDQERRKQYFEPNKIVSTSRYSCDPCHGVISSFYGVRCHFIFVESFYLVYSVTYLQPIPSTVNTVCIIHFPVFPIHFHNPRNSIHSFLQAKPQATRPAAQQGSSAKANHTMGRPKNVVKRSRTLPISVPSPAADRLACPETHGRATLGGFQGCPPYSPSHAGTANLPC